MLRQNWKALMVLAITLMIALVISYVTISGIRDTSRRTDEQLALSQEKVRLGEIEHKAMKELIASFDECNTAIGDLLKAKEE